MSVSQIEAGRAFLKLITDDTEFRKGLDGALKQLDAFGKSAIRIGATIGAAGAAITAPFAALLTSFSNAGSELADIQSRTHLTAESLSVLKYAAEQSGLGLQTIEKAARELQKEGLDPNRIIDYARELAAIEDPTKRTTRAMELFGSKAGPALDAISVYLAQAEKDVKRFGLGWSQQMIDSADATGDAAAGLMMQLKMLGHTIATAVAPAVVKVIEYLQQVIPEFTRWAAQHPTLISNIGKMGVALVGLGAAMTALGQAGRIASTAINAVSFAAANPALLKITALTAAIYALHRAMRYLAGASEDEITPLLESVGDAAAQASGLVPSEERSKANAERAAHRARVAEDLAAQRRFGAGTLFNNIVGMLPGQAQAAITGAKLPSGVEELFKGLGGALAGLSNSLVSSDPQAEMRKKAAALQKELDDQIQSQLSAFSRGLRGGVGGQSAEQIVGSTRAQSREERMLKVNEGILKELGEIKTELKKAKPLLTGPS